MSDKSERAYHWIDDRANRLSRWLDVNRPRIAIALTAASVSWYGYRMPNGTFLNSISPELFGIVLTAVVIDYINERRQTQQLKAQLIRQMGSNIRDVAVPAARELAHQGWLFDGSLRGVGLWRANLREAVLITANLSEVDLGAANLSSALLAKANLSGANMEVTNLSEAYLMGVNLSQAKLSFANMSGADLEEANLSGAALEAANLSEAHLEGANLSETYLEGANLSGANLGRVNLIRANLARANLSKAKLREANLREVKDWSILQLELSSKLMGTIMPDGVQLGREETEFQKRIDGPTYEEWKAKYLAKHGGTATDLRDMYGLDDIS